MLLAEALSQRSDASKRLAQVQSRFSNAARFFEGDEPEEDASALLEQARALVAEVGGLVRRINRTNAVSEVEPGVTIADVIAMRDEVSSRRKVVVAMVDAARAERGYGARSKDEVHAVLSPSLDVKALRREADALAAEFRRLDVQLQAANFTTPVVS